MTIDARPIAANLSAILDEIRQQLDVGAGFPPALQAFPAQVELIREWIEDANEFGIAYESLVSMLEEFPFQLSGPTAVKLLEVGLAMRFKTERPQDAPFDFR